MKALIVLLFILVSPQLQAKIWCSGKIERVLVRDDGALGIVSSGIYGNTTGRDLCHVDNSIGVVSPSTCESWMKLATTSKITGFNLVVVYNSSSSCSAVSDWGNAEIPFNVYIE